MRRRIDPVFTGAVAAVFVVVFPAGGPAWFAGMPLGALELIIVLLLLPLLVSRSSRKALAASAPLRAGTLARRLLPALIIVAAVAKLALVVAGEPEGWGACYRPLDAPMIATGCERSYENPLFLDDVTRYDEELSFGSASEAGPALAASTSNWNLSFWNSLRWNELDPEGYRERLPFEVLWRGEVGVEPGTVAVHYVGEGEVRIGPRTATLPESYGRPASVTLQPRPGAQAVQIRYRFDSRDDPSTEGAPFAYFVVEGLAPPTASATTAGLGYLVDAVVVLLMAALIAAYAGLLRGRLTWPYIASSAAVAALLIPDWPEGFSLSLRVSLAIVAALAALAARPSRQGMLITAGLILVANAIWVAAGVPGLDAVLYRTAGSDFLTYESFARSILETGSLQGGEDVFYYQPGMRYLIFGLHVLFGDSDVLISVIARSAVVIGIVLAAGIAWVHGRSGPLVRVAGFAVASLVVLLMTIDGDSVQRIDAGLSEWPVWALMPLGCALLLAGGDRRWTLGGVALLAACVLLRTNVAPAVILIVALGLAIKWRADRSWVIACLAVFVAMLSLPLIHNIAYGGEAVVTTTSANIPANVTLPLSELPRAFSDESVRSTLENQVRALLYAGPEASSGPLRLVFRLLQLAYLLALVGLVVRWRPTTPAARVLMIAPIVFFLPFLSYNALPYYPRHIVAGYVLIATAVLLASSGFGLRGERGDSNLDYAGVR